MRDLSLLLYPFALGFFVGGAVVAVAVVETSDSRVRAAVRRAEVESARASRTCDLAVREARELLMLMQDERRTACESTPTTGLSAR